ncbi:MAG: DNA polymerase IV [Gammaproteobacteria bacterium]|nr:DNA polymerase IV [Gammaproteobacteria bacterium]
MDTAHEKQRWIGHADIDAFYASVEQRDCPAYRGRPVVVGALPGQRGVVAAASYEARRYGIHSAMPIAEAHRRCPDAVFVRPDMARYQRVSREIFDILGSITPVVEPVSVDEAYLDLSGLERLIGPPDEIGREIRRRVFDGTGLTASVGIGPNRLIAKLGSEHRKPDGLTVIAPHEVADFLAPLPISKLRGLGGQTQKLFARLGIETVRQLRTIPLPYLEQHLGHGAAAKFHAQAHGLGSTEVTPGRQRKSISKETTFQDDVADHALLRDVLRGLAAEVAATARREGLSGTVVTLKLRLTGFETHTRQHRLAAPTHDERVLLREAWSLFLTSGLPKRPLRLIGVGLSGWQSGEVEQVDLFAPAGGTQRNERVLQILDRAADRFGKGSLQLGGRRPQGPPKTK